MRLITEHLVEPKLFDRVGLPPTLVVSVSLHLTPCTIGTGFFGELVLLPGHDLSELSLPILLGRVFPEHFAKI